MPSADASAQPDANAEDFSPVTFKTPSSSSTEAPGLLQSLSISALPPVSFGPFASGFAAWLTCKSPYKTGENEDAVASIALSPQQGMLLVADGLGGHRGGRRASQLVKTMLTRALKRKSSTPPLMLSGIVPVPSAANSAAEIDAPRAIVLNEIERVNQRLIRSRTGAATTLALVEIRKNLARSYHIGDSEILVVSQRGRVKFSSVSHSPIGYAVESGMLTKEEALFHPDRHLVSNVIGSDQMSIELGPWISLSPRDTVLLASDGLFDNLTLEEIVDRIRKGKLNDCVQRLADLSRNRMLAPSLDTPSKPDDLSILLFRLTN
ncbi:PP2C family protein-serine/threonine phosphatase [Planctomicrobium sp. SH668]|uniref:PP2C family protein-serine/threonine phosphatase n=1 Tax=Planctomicrobium sp. SH668 TaxID=3448126 RepID=UPI003F5BA3D2